LLGSKLHHLLIHQHDFGEDNNEEFDDDPNGNFGDDNNEEFDLELNDLV
jgi:hypothetical protein